MQRLYRMFLVVCLSVWVSACVNNSFDEGISAFKLQDYRAAFIRLKPSAEKGQRDAQYAIGYMYYYGQGVVEDRKKAWYWIKAAARQGQPEALIALQILSGRNTK